MVTRFVTILFLFSDTYAHVVPGAVTPLWEPTYNMSRSTIAMICNSTGRIDPFWAAQWGLIDLDWNGNKKQWSSVSPMNVEEDMRENMEQVKAINPLTKTWVYRNGVKALPVSKSFPSLLSLMLIAELACG